MLRAEPTAGRFDIEDLLPHLELTPTETLTCEDLEDPLFDPSVEPGCRIALAAFEQRMAQGSILGGIFFSTSTPTTAPRPAPRRELTLPSMKATGEQDSRETRTPAISGFSG